MPDTVAIDGLTLPVRTPADAVELGTLVRETAAIYPVGGGTHLHIGRPPTVPGVAVSMRAFDRIIDHAARDMTITVQTGVTFTTLAAALARENQWLPVEVPHPDRSTLGGALAANRSGPRRLGQGTLRDYVIGISFVTDEGLEVKGGGRVVKNVAGYDLMKLHISALGTLGVVTQLTLKVKPRPEATALVAFGMNAAAVGPTLDRLHASASRPVAVELLNAPAAAAVGVESEEPWVIVCGFEEKRVTVEWQIETLLGELKAAPVRGVRTFLDTEAVPLWESLSRLGDGSPDALTVKANTLPSHSAAVAAAIATTAEAVVQAHAGSGIVRAHFLADGLERTAAMIAKWSKLLTAHNANLVIERCPTEWKLRLPVWGRTTSDRATMRAVKQALDPAGKFNPGRWE